MFCFSDVIVTFWQAEHDVGAEDGLAAEIGEAGGRDGGSSWDSGEGVEEVPEGGAVGDGVADGAAEEDAVGEVGDLEGHDWGGMSGVTDFVVEGEELFCFIWCYVLQFSSIPCSVPPLFQFYVLLWIMLSDGIRD